MIRSTLCLILLLLLAPAVRAEDPETFAKAFLTGSRDSDRVEAGVKLAAADPERFAKALDEIVAGKKASDMSVLAAVATKVPVRHIRLLTVWAVTEMGDAVPVFIRRIDDLRPDESARAAEALGFIGDKAAVDALLKLVLTGDEIPGVNAARALARITPRKRAPEILAAALEIENNHIRRHLAWALRDVAGSGAKAKGMFDRHRKAEGDEGKRAMQASTALADARVKAIKYKPALESIRKSFGRKGGVKLPPIKAKPEQRKRIEAVLEDLSKKAPDYYHLICSGITEITVTDDVQVLDYRKGKVNIRPYDINLWGKRDELYTYFLVRNATILFLGRLGDPTDGHRGWGEGLAESWYFAKAHTDIGVAESLAKYLKKAVRKAPWKW